MTSTTSPVTARPSLTARPLRCRNCGAERAAGPVSICEQCLGPLDPVYEPGRRLPDRQTIAARAPSLWRYREWLPFDGEPVLSLDSGFTPLIEAPALARRFGVARAWVKNDTVCQPALLLRGRVEDPRLRDRGAARMAAPDGGGGADGGRLARHPATQRIRGVPRGGPGPRRRAAAVWRAGGRVRTDRPASGARRHAARARSPQHHLPLARDRQPCGRPVRRPRRARVGSLGGPRE